MARKDNFIKRLMAEKYDAIEILELGEDGDAEFDKWESQFIRSQFEQTETHRRTKLAEESEY
jgi:hypothetical protein